LCLLPIVQCFSKQCLFFKIRWSAFLTFFPIQLVNILNIFFQTSWSIF
jgi:hypothetical protein